MGTKIVTILIAFIFIASCDPPRQFCDDIGTFARVPDLITLEPLQDTYHKGDVVTLKGSIANISPYFAESNVNLMEATGLQSALLIGGSETLFESNDLNFIKGSHGEMSNWYIMPYNPENESYEFEIKITLNHIGRYNFFSGYQIDIIGEDCKNYRIKTNITGDNEEDMIIFDVLE